MRLISSSELPAAAAALAAGDLVVAPTQRWYMICADASNANACSRMFVGKGRLPTKPLAFVLPTTTAADALFVVSTQARRLVDAFWPGELALILPWRDRLYGDIHASVGSPNALVTSDPGILGELAALSKVPIATTTVSLSHRTEAAGPALTAAAVRRFAELADMTFALCIDGGVCPLNSHLTIVDCTSPDSKLVRSGVVDGQAIEAALHDWH